VHPKNVLLASVVHGISCLSDYSIVADLIPNMIWYTSYIMSLCQSGESAIPRLQSVLRGKYQIEINLKIHHAARKNMVHFLIF
jgi:hypothetical protein